LKILEADSVDAVNASEITFSAVVSFPLVVLVFLYVNSTGEYQPVGVTFDSTKLYLAGGGASGDTYHYFICYA